MIQHLLIRPQNLLSRLDEGTCLGMIPWSYLWKRQLPPHRIETISWKKQTKTSLRVNKFESINYKRIQFCNFIQKILYLFFLIKQTHIKGIKVMHQRISHVLSKKLEKGSEEFPSLIARERKGNHIWRNIWSICIPMLPGWRSKM